MNNKKRKDEKMLKTWKLMCVCTVLGLFTAGCQNTVNTVENTDKQMAVETIRDTRFVTDDYLKDRLALKKIDVATTPDGFMQVQLEAMNLRTGGLDQIWSSLTGENPYKIRYKFIWFNKDGMTMDTILSDWREVTVIPGETIYLRSVAPSRDCKDFQISLQETE